MMNKLLKAIEREGYWGVFPYIVKRFSLRKRIVRFCFAPVAIPTAVGILCIAPWIKIRLILLFSNLIGHYTYNTELLCSVLELSQDKSNKKIKNLFYTAPPICNTQLHAMWKRKLTILPLAPLLGQIDFYLLHFSKRYRSDPIKQFFMPGGRTWDAWNLLGTTKGPHIEFTPEEIKKGQALIRALGIPEGVPFVCFVGRDARYHTVHIPKWNYHYMKYRNVDIQTYQLAAEFLADRGYYVLRMGKHVEHPFHSRHPRIIDYANHPLRSDFGDIYLIAHCFFFMSVSTGLDSVAQIFRKPILQTNVPFLDPDFHPDWHLMITKKVLNLKNNKYLTQKEIAQIFSWKKIDKAKRIPEMLEAHGLVQLNNTAEEIKQAAEEMLNRLLGNWHTTVDDEKLQQKFWRSYQDTGVRSIGAPLPPLTIPALKVPVFEDQNLEFNRRMHDVRLRMSAVYLRENEQWLIDQSLFAIAEEQ